MNRLHPVRRFKYMFGIYGKNRRASCFFKALFIIIIAALIFSAAESRLGSAALRLAEAQLKNELTYECNRIVRELTDNRQTNVIRPPELSHTDSGSVTSASTDLTSINTLKTDVSLRLSEYLMSKNKINCSVPIGSVFSDEMFAAYGFQIPTRVICSASSAIDFDDDFISAGINQTRYRLMLKITVDANLHTVFRSHNSKITVDVPISETIIVGDVPTVLPGIFEK